MLHQFTAVSHLQATTTGALIRRRPRTIAAVGLSMVLVALLRGQLSLISTAPPLTPLIAPVVGVRGGSIPAELVPGPSARPEG